MFTRGLRASLASGLAGKHPVHKPLICKAKIPLIFRSKPLDIEGSGRIMAGSLRLAGPGVGQFQT